MKHLFKEIFHGIPYVLGITAVMAGAMALRLAMYAPHFTHIFGF